MKKYALTLSTFALLASLTFHFGFSKDNEIYGELSEIEEIAASCSCPTEFVSIRLNSNLTVTICNCYNFRGDGHQRCTCEYEPLPDNQ